MQVALLSREVARHGEAARAHRETALAVHAGAKQRAELEAALAAAQAAAARECERAEAAEARVLSEGDARAQAERGAALARLEAEEAARRGAEALSGADRRVVWTHRVLSWSVCSGYLVLSSSQRSTQYINTLQARRHAPPPE